MIFLFSSSIFTSNSDIRIHTHSLPLKRGLFPPFGLFLRGVEAVKGWPPQALRSRRFSLHLINLISAPKRRSYRLRACKGAHPGSPFSSLGGQRENWRKQEYAWIGWKSAGLCVWLKLVHHGNCGVPNLDTCSNQPKCLSRLCRLSIA